MWKIIQIIIIIGLSFLLLTINSFFSFSVNQDGLFSIAFGYLIIGFVSYLIRVYSSFEAPLKFLLSSSSFFITTIVFVSDDWSRLFLLIIPIIIIYLCIVVSKWNSKRIGLALLMFFIFIFILNPFWTIVGDSDFNKITLENEIINIDDKYYIFETWHEHCSVCFESMKDLHPFFQKNGQIFNYEHFYLYVGQEDNLSLIKNNKYLPYENMQIIKDEELKIYNKSKMSGAPYFLILDSEGNSVLKISGYWSPYKIYYKLYFYFIFKMNL